MVETDECSRRSSWRKDSMPQHNVCRQIVAQHLLLKNWMPVVAILDVFLTSLFQNIDVQEQFSLDVSTYDHRHIHGKYHLLIGPGMN